ncbi:MAG TPA: OmpA family protein [Bacteroidales bacterium]|nr:OmpA family protein [Bacteroidales bacterium]HOL97530.1 OmpA family protein [Bacteroidales bacterium]HOM35798.1 OmpA family protein [Bacteroidales bacterium]HPD22984.1 OmpA family protein [Bacteroidales bacterium]HRS98823.1 OmpA family protein [Bacteroidales bacterium]
MKKILLIYFLMLPCIILFSQEKSKYTTNKKAIKSFNKSVALMERHQNNAAVMEINKAVEIDPGFLEAWLLKAEIHDFLGDVWESYLAYKNVFEIDPFYDTGLCYKLAVLAYRAGEYSNAKQFIDFFYKNADTVKYLKYDFQRLKKYIYFADSAYNNPVPFTPINLGPGVNTHFDEYWPSLSIDEHVLVFTRQIPLNPNNSSRAQSNMHEDLFVSYYDPEFKMFGTAIPLPGNINTKLNEGAQCISGDGKTIVFTACNRPDGLGSCDLYIMFLVDGKWTAPKNMKTVNSPYWDSNPSLSADGRFLYFASGRPGGKGKTDIWVVEIDNQGNAVSPVFNLGDPLNTEYEEISPFIHPDGRTLYFASQGHPGMGDFDLFYSRRDEKTGKWSKPVNLGYPINTNGEERSLIVNARGDIALFASTKGKNDLDIYFFKIPEEIKPIATTYVTGYVYDIVTNQRLEAICELIDLKTENLVSTVLSDAKTGEYMVSLPVDKDYAFNVDKRGYLFYSENFSLSNLETPDKPYVMNIPLQPLTEGVTVILKNIFFEFDSYELLPESFAELNKVLEYLNNNPGLVIEIGGHTDNRGSKAYNKTLSENRAKSVFDYLVSKGIDKKRLSYKGYDFSVPIATNDTEEGRALNRRTEFKVISNKP